MLSFAVGFFRFSDTILTVYYFVFPDAIFKAVLVTSLLCICIDSLRYVENAMAINYPKRVKQLNWILNM